MKSRGTPHESGGTPGFGIFFRDIVNGMARSTLSSQTANAVRLATKEDLAQFLGVLMTGQPICSQSVKIDKGQFLDSLTSTKSAEELYAILPPAEQPLTLATILACGWMLKTTYCC